MSLVLDKHQARIEWEVHTYRERIKEVEGDLRLRAMTQSSTGHELALLQRLKDEYGQILYVYENLSEAIRAVRS